MSTELKALQQELHELIGRLDTAADGIARGFQGIGSEYCAAGLRDVAREYRGLEKRLEAVIAAAGKE